MRIYGIAIVLAAALAAVSCTRGGDSARGGERRELSVSVRMESSDWTTRSSAAQARMAQAQAAQQARCSNGASGARIANSASRASAPVSLDERLEIVTEYGTQETPETPLTRGTPMGSAAELKTLGFAVYTNSAFTKNFTATNSNGSWSIAGNMKVEVDKDTYSYYAYAPTAAGDNGIKLNEADGKTLTYTAPTDITKQPDLCMATPITNDKSGSVTFAMQHALTAIGIKVRAANVTIKSITLTQVGTSGKLDLTTGAWGGVGTPKDLAFALSTSTPTTGDREDNITPVNGYLMLPPQSLTGDNQTLVIVYQYKDEAVKTGIHKLRDITGGAWAAGQKINYVIQLKSNFSLSLSPASATVPLTAGKYEFGYTTGSSAPSIDPQATDDVDWVTGLKADPATSKISFDYAANTTGMPRKTDITVTSGFTTQTFTLTQEGPPYVLIAGTYWTKTNLTGDAGTNTGHKLMINPHDYGMFFKWGSSFIYQRASNGSDGGGWGDYITGAPNQPASGSNSGYDYGLGLSGGTNPGDPCQKLNARYKTPTYAQWVELNKKGSLWSSYNGIPGRFFGPSAGSCNNTTLQDGCIFFPASGFRDNWTGAQNGQGGEGNYWLSSMPGHYMYGYSFGFNSGSVSDYRHSWRGIGMSVRCIFVP